jgi:MFS family permease
MALVIGGEKLIRILANRSFRNIWLANLLSMMGSQVSRIGLILYVFETGDTVLNLALLVVLDTLPGALVAPVAGAMVDRLNKRVVMVASDLSRMVFMLVILARPSLGVIYLMAALHSIATVFFQPAKTASIPLIVKQDDLLRANAIDQSAANVVLIAGPVVGALLLKHFGLAASLLLDAATFLTSALLLARVSIRRVEREQDAPLSAAGAISEIKEGWRYLARHGLALHLNVLLFMALICTSIWIPLAPFFIRDHLGGAEHILGWQLSLFGFGAVVGGLLAPRLVERFGTGVALFAGFLAEAISLSLYGMVSHVGASMVIIFIWGVVISVVVVPFYSILQKIVEEQFLGRVFSVVKQSENMATVLAMTGAVLLQDSFGSHLIFLFAGLTYFGFTAISSLSRNGRMLLATR